VTLGPAHPSVTGSNSIDAVFWSLSFLVALVFAAELVLRSVLQSKVRTYIINTSRIRFKCRLKEQSKVRLRRAYTIYIKRILFMESQLSCGARLRRRARASLRPPVQGSFECG